ncbi:phosphotransferase [Streptomyces sp. NPDC050988]|uniref:phosphotransferase n=1 Tax=Streptomyces sp. NPDC050988 TaxID=3365637 RepID=UPI0037A5CAA0
MSDEQPTEIVLTGGRMATRVVWTGDTVRKPSTDTSPFVAELLNLLETKGFQGAPRYVGQAEGSDIFTFIDGRVPARFQAWSDSQVQAAARLLRQMHDATSGSTLAGHSEVVCHHDPGPNNYVFQCKVPIALIDFAEAAPGSRLEDVAYLAWTWSISSALRLPLERQAQQVRLIADAYSLQEAERLALIDSVMDRQLRNVRFWARFLAHPATAPAAPQVLNDRIAWSHREHAFTLLHREVFDTVLR